MAKFELATFVKRKCHSDYGKNTSTEHGIGTIFERFCETLSVEDGSQSGRPAWINQENVDEVNDFLRAHPESIVWSVVEAPSMPQTTTYRIMTEHLLLKPDRAQFIQQLYERYFRDRVEMCQIIIIITSYRLIAFWDRMRLLLGFTCSRFLPSFSFYVWRYLHPFRSTY